MGFLANMMAATAQMVMKSGISVVTQLDSTSFRELISPMIRASIFPVGRLSKNWKSSVCIWVYSSWRMVTSMLLQTFAMMYIRIFTPAIMRMFKSRAKAISRISPVISPVAIWSSMADSIINGLSSDTTTQNAMMSSTKKISFR